MQFLRSAVAAVILAALPVAEAQTPALAEVDVSGLDLPKDHARLVARMLRTMHKVCGYRADGFYHLQTTGELRRPYEDCVASLSIPPGASPGVRAAFLEARSRM